MTVNTFILNMNIIPMHDVDTNRIPYTFSVLALQTRDTMTDAQFNTMMENGLAKAKAGQGVTVDDAFAEINNSI